jgi:hypothetical protein
VDDEKSSAATGRRIRISAGESFSVASLKSPRALFRGVLKLVLFLVPAFGLLLVLETAFAPWVRSFGLWRTLTGEWFGTLRAPDGKISFVYFDIRGAVQQQSPDIYGKAKWCDEAGRIQTYDIYGEPDNWRGSRFHLTTRSSTPRESGVSLGELQGAWTGDAIRATGELVTHGRSVTVSATRSSRSPSVPRVAYLLHRGSEARFMTACGR